MSPTTGYLFRSFLVFQTNGAFYSPQVFPQARRSSRGLSRQEFNLVNLVNFQTTIGGSHETFPFVISDIASSGQIPINPDGASVQVGTEGGVPVIATFHDLGDVATAPDTGRTASLCGLSLMGLAFLRRKFVLS